MREVARAGGSREEKADQLAQIPISPADGKASTPLGEVRTRLSLEASARFLESVDPEVFTPIIEGRWLDGYDQETFFGRIECPLLLLQGDAAAGAALTEADVLLARSTAAHCQLKQFPGTGHMIHGECPEGMLRAIDEFVLGLGGRRMEAVSSRPSSQSTWADEAFSNSPSLPNSDQTM
jgi:pimeloyl-ACP methyl ester carboxylesterase